MRHALLVAVLLPVGCAMPKPDECPGCGADGERAPNLRDLKGISPDLAAVKGQDLAGVVAAQDLAAPQDFAGVEDGGACPAPLVRCGGACVDTQSSNDHCGGCGSACGMGQFCFNGACLCGPKSCNGCCTGSTCHPGNADGACGAGGGACKACGGSKCINGGCSGCKPGDTETQACGNCGTQTRTCDNMGQWTPFGGCMGEGACMPGETRTTTCGNCGTQTDTCQMNCQWGVGLCQNQGPCRPGAMRLGQCGNCNLGAALQSCNNSCQWQNIGPCAEVGCKPGTTRDVPCGNCGTSTETCSQLCLWSAGACKGQGPCKPGTVEKPGPCDKCSQRTCRNDCTWGGCSLQPGNTCEHKNGTNARACKCNGACGGDPLQWCLPSCVWSTACDCCTQGGCNRCN